MTFSEDDFIWSQQQLECIWQSNDNRFILNHFLPMPKNYIFADAVHEQYIIFLAEDNSDAIDVSKNLSNILNGR